jgi:hypothetical protein
VGTAARGTRATVSVGGTGNGPLAHSDSLISQVAAKNINTTGHISAVFTYLNETAWPPC